MPGATIAPDKTFFDLDPAQFQTVLNLNLTGTVIPTQVFLKPMVKQGKGSIINFSSMAAFRPMTRVCGYAAAKAGISNFTAYNESVHQVVQHTYRALQWTQCISLLAFCVV